MERAVGRNRWNRLLRRPVLSAEAVALVAAVYLTFLGNTSFWSAVCHALGDVRARPIFLAAIVTLVFVTFVMLATLFNFKGVFKSTVATLLLISAVVDHLMRAHGIVIDVTMVQNTAETDAREALELITPRLLVHVFLMGVLPAAFLLSIKVRYRKPWSDLAARLLVLVGGATILFALALLGYRDLAGFARDNRQLRHVITPFNYVAAVRDYLHWQGSRNPGPKESLAPDARLSTAARGRARRKLIVLVVGETARAASFSLDGYARATNPQLALENVVSYTQFRSCGTATAASLPCMFSGMRRSEYDGHVAKHRENLLDVLLRAGVSVVWRENNSGCKGACLRVPTDDLSHATVPEYCSSGECFDEILLDGLDGALSHLDADSLIVLHQKGSHGPAYDHRYPPRFRKFLPVCETNDLHDCSRESIVNAYDNTILYTDHVLSELIDLLRRHADHLDAGLVYVSDHGESLGERNVYLHGLPYSIAPDEQTHIPFILWFSAGLERDLGLDHTCIASGREERGSHDNVFHTVLGLMEVETKVYEPELDLLARCRGAELRAAREIEPVGGAPLPLVAMLPVSTSYLDERSAVRERGSSLRSCSAR